jgi:O-6-methylguanine DNA methyltransferase
MKDFRNKVLEIVKSIPRGGVMSYGEVARRAGNARAAQAVGAIMQANHDPAVPCHRVIKSNGQLGGFNRGPEKKQNLLRSEGYLG